MFVIQALTMVLPIAASGVTLIVVMSRGWLPALNRPLDGGALWRGAPVIGSNKTVRGLVVHAVVATAVVGALHTFAPAPWLAPQYAENPVWLGLTISLSYVAGEVANSFVKRRLGIVPGGVGVRGGQWQRFVDNVDGSLATGVALLVAYRVPLELLVATGVVGVVVHEVTDAVMRRLGLKGEKE